MSAERRLGSVLVSRCSLSSRAAGMRMVMAATCQGLSCHVVMVLDGVCLLESCEWIISAVVSVDVFEQLVMCGMSWLHAIAVPIPNR